MLGWVVSKWPISAHAFIGVHVFSEIAGQLQASWACTAGEAHAVQALGTDFLVLSFVGLTCTSTPSASAASCRCSAAVDESSNIRQHSATWIWDVDAVCKDAAAQVHVSRQLAQLVLLVRTEAVTLPGSVGPESLGASVQMRHLDGSVW
jgi:hypothetical protein